MSKNFLNIYLSLIFLLFTIAPFVMSFDSAETATLIKANTLPSIVSSLSGFVRWVLFAVISFICILELQKQNNVLKFSIPVKLLSFFYFIQLCYAVVDNYDILRFFFLTIFSLLIPPVISLVITNKPIVLKYFSYAIVLFIVVSLLLNSHMIITGQRFFGFQNNPNAFGLSTIFWMIIILFAYQKKLIHKYLFYFVFAITFLLMLFTGSRNAMVGMLLILTLHYIVSMKNLGTTLLVGIVALLIGSYFIDFTSFTTRLMNVSEAISDSGRSEIWERAYFAIDNSFWWGNGLNANNEIAFTGNMHNSYVRFLLNMGFVFTVFVVGIYFSIILFCFKYKNIMPLVLIGYLI